MFFYPHRERQVILVEIDHFRKAEFKISGMTCQGCAEHVMYEVNKLPGILKVEASFEKDNAVVEFDESKVSLAEIKNSINGTGYKVVDTAAK